MQSVRARLVRAATYANTKPEAALWPKHTRQVPDGRLLCVKMHPAAVSQLGAQQRIQRKLSSNVQVLLAENLLSANLEFRDGHKDETEGNS